MQRAHEADSDRLYAYDVRVQITMLTMANEDHRQQQYCSGPVDEFHTCASSGYISPRQAARQSLWDASEQQSSSSRQLHPIQLFHHAYWLKQFSPLKNKSRR